MAQEPANQRDTGRAAQAGSGAILVVDDEEAVRKLTARMLCSGGFDAIEASSGAAAVERLEREAPRIRAAVVDVVMAEMNGRDLGAIIERRWPHIRVLYMTGYAALRSAGTGPLAPPRPLIFKPFTSDQLLARLRSLIEGAGGEGAGGAR